MKNFLIVDDSFTIRKVIDMLLTPLGYKLTFAENAEKALELLKTGNYEVVLVDKGLPDINGLAISKEIKKINPSISVILMINAKEELDEVKRKESMIDDVVEKPFDSQTFISKIDAIKDKVVSIEKPKEEPMKLEEEPFKIDIGLGEEFEFKPEKTEELIEEIEELKEIEEIKEIEEVVDIETIEEAKETELIEEEPLSLTEAKEEVVEEIQLEDLLEEGEIKIEEEPPAKEAFKEEVNVNIEDLFSDLNDILKESEEPELKKEPEIPYKKVDYKPVVEEVAKELKEFDSFVDEKEEEEKALEELDIWDFVPEQEQEQKPKPVAEQVIEKTSDLIRDKAELERMIKEITYEVVEKVAWEVVPEILDTVLKDKFGKR